MYNAGSLSRQQYAKYTVLDAFFEESRIRQIVHIAMCMLLCSMRCSRSAQLCCGERYAHVDACIISRLHGLQIAYVHVFSSIFVLLAQKKGRRVVRLAPRHPSSFFDRKVRYHGCTEMNAEMSMAFTQISMG